MPRRPSSRQITLPVPIMPLYSLPVPYGFFDALWLKPPWACSFVLITSSGQVTTPDAKPAPAPQIGDTHAFGICADCICILATKESLDDVEDIVLVRLLLLSAGIAYWDKMVGVVESVLRSKDIERWLGDSISNELGCCARMASSWRTVRSCDVEVQRRE
jgi:hypothetical protein